MSLQEICEQSIKMANNNFFDFLAYVYNFFIDNHENGTVLFKDFVESRFDKDTFDKDTESTVMPKMVLNELLGKYKILTNGFIDYLISEHLSEEEFYQRLWSVIHDREFYGDSRASMIAFMWVCRNSRIPYFYLPEGIQMDNDEFKECQKQLQGKLEKLSFVLRSKYSQKTERASVLLSIINDGADEKERAVLLARVLAWIENEEKQEKD